MTRSLLSLLLPLLLLSAAAAVAQPPFFVVPENPRPGDVFAIQATYHTSCPFLRGEVVVDGSVVRILALQGCVCSLAPPIPVTVTTFVGPLAEGSYDVELWVAGEELGSLCGPPGLVEATELAVVAGGEPGFISVSPFPAPAEGFRLTLRSPCPAQISYAPVGVDGRVITLVRRNNSAILAPCAGTLVEVAAFDLGPLPPGVYAVRHFTVEVSADGEEIAPRMFEYAFPLPVGDPPRLTLRGGRFTVETAWRTAVAAGVGQPVPLTGESGYFWFFSPANAEVLVKILNGCPVNHRVWAFAAGLTNVEVELVVVDGVSGEVRSFANPLGVPFPPVQATAAFAVCPLIEP